MALEKIAQKLDEVDITEDQRARIKFQKKECARAILAWKAHLVRSVAQEEAKQDALVQLDQEKCLIIMDWAMKHLPQYYREQMSEFFGKRGRSWHVSAVITRLHAEGRYEVECFVHLFNTCNQNSFAVMSVIEHLLQTIKLEFLSINKAFPRPDNSGCYHNGPLILSLPLMGEKGVMSRCATTFQISRLGKISVTGKPRP